MRAELVYKDVEKVIIEKEEVVELTLSKEEAMNLLGILAHIGGGVHHPLRASTDRMYKSLNTLFPYQQEREIHVSDKAYIEQVLHSVETPMQITSSPEDIKKWRSSAERYNLWKNLKSQ